MANLVRCSICGKGFNFDAGGKYDDKTGRFICPDCVSEASPSRKQKLRPRIGSTITKLIFSFIFIAFSIEEGFADPGNMAFGLAIGLPLLLWAAVPWLLYRKDLQRQEEFEKRLFEEKQRLRREFDEQPRICPGCGATTRGKVCEYCGTKLT